MHRLAALTGAGGFVGQHVLAALVAEGWHVRALVRRSQPAETGPGVQFIQGSLQSPTALHELVQDATAVIHCAGLTKARAAGEFEAANVAGTAALVDAALRQPEQPRFLLVSSLAAREPTLSAYAASKRRAELVLENRKDALDWLAVRPPAVYGPHDTATLPMFRQMQRGFVLGPRSRGRRLSLIHARDLARALVAAAGAARPLAGLAEVRDAQADGYTWPDLAVAASESLGHSVRYVGLPGSFLRLAALGSMALAAVSGTTSMLTTDKVREVMHRDWVCRATLLNSLVEWQPEVGLAEGFAETLAWYRQSGWL